MTTTFATTSLRAWRVRTAALTTAAKHHSVAIRTYSIPSLPHVLQVQPLDLTPDGASQQWVRREMVSALLSNDSLLLVKDKGCWMIQHTLQCYPAFVERIQCVCNALESVGGHVHTVRTKGSDDEVVLSFTECCDVVLSAALTLLERMNLHNVLSSDLALEVFSFCSKFSSHWWPLIFAVSDATLRAGLRIKTLVMHDDLFCVSTIFGAAQRGHRTPPSLGVNLLTYALFRPQSVCLFV